MQVKHGFTELRSQVIDKGLCTLCGTCVGICPKESLSLVYENDEVHVGLKGNCSICGTCYQACPGADIPMPELEKFCFGSVSEKKAGDLGIFNYSGMGYATDDRIRRAGASGGVTTALLIYGLEKGLIDCALVAGFSREKPWRTEAKIATNREELIEAAQSKYAPVAINSVLNEAVVRGFQHIAIVGCPAIFTPSEKWNTSIWSTKSPKRLSFYWGYSAVHNSTSRGPTCAGGEVRHIRPDAYHPNAISG